MSAFSSKIKNLSGFQSTASAKPGEILVEIDPKKIVYLAQDRRKDNPGLTHDSLKELAADLKSNGQLQPVIVRNHPDKKGFYIMVAGERRGRACEIGRLKLKAFVRDLDDDQHRRIQRAENIQREALTQYEIANALRKDKDKFGTLEAVAKEWNKGINWVSERLRFADAIEAGGAATSAVTEGLTSDISTVVGLAKLEKKNPEAAAQVVTQVKADPKVNVRGAVIDALKDEKAKSSKPKVNATQNDNEAPLPTRKPANNKGKVPGLAEWLDKDSSDDRPLSLLRTPSGVWALNSGKGDAFITSYHSLDDLVATLANYSRQSGRDLANAILDISSVSSEA